MNRNVGLLDRLVRVTISGALIYFLLYGVLSYTMSVIAIVMAIVLLVTGVLDMCPLYGFLGFSTYRSDRG